MEKIELLEVQSQRLYFRRLRATDLELASCVLQNAETMAAWDRPYDRSDTLDFIADMLRRYRTDGIGYVAAFEKQTDELVALCGLLAEQLDGRPAVSLGCIVRSEKRFHGFGRECLSAMLSCAFARLELDRVVSFIQRRCAPDRCRVRHEADRPLRARPCRSGRPSRRSRDAQSARRTGRHKLNTAQKSCPSGDFLSERQLFSSIQCLCETSAS